MNNVLLCFNWSVELLMQEYGTNAFLEADLGCSNALRVMKKRLEAACQVPDAKIDHVVMVCFLIV